MKKSIFAFGIATSLLFSSYLPSDHAKAASVSFESNLINQSKQYIGVPYKWGGSSPSGFDCSGFVGYVYNKAGVSLPRTAAGMFSSSSLDKVTAKQPGDLVFFRTMNKSSVTHVGMYVGDNQFIHASSSKGVMISSLGTSYWKSAFAGAKRHSAVGQVKAVSAENYDQSAKELWLNMQSAYSASPKITSLNANYLGEYNRLRNKSDSSSFKDYMLRSARMIDALKSGFALDQIVNDYNKNVIEGQRLDSNTNKSYDELSEKLKKTESLIGKVYGASNRKVFTDRFIMKAKIARETSKYEVSMYRLMNTIDALAADGSTKAAIEHFEKLSRLEARASTIKASGNALHPGKYGSLSSLNSQLKNRKQAIENKLGL